MKAITITIDEELDARAAKEARRRGISKSALIRDSVRRMLPNPPEAPQETDENLWVTLGGFGPPDVTVEPGEIDDVIYGT